VVVPRFDTELNENVEELVVATENTPLYPVLPLIVTVFDPIGGFRELLHTTV
jgi:hypothetical protein